MLCVLRVFLSRIDICGRLHLSLGLHWSTPVTNDVNKASVAYGNLKVLKVEEGCPGLQSQHERVSLDPKGHYLLLEVDKF